MAKHVPLNARRRKCEWQTDQTTERFIGVMVLIAVAHTVAICGLAYFVLHAEEASAQSATQSTHVSPRFADRRSAYPDVASDLRCRFERISTLSLLAELNDMLNH